MTNITRTTSASRLDEGFALLGGEMRELRQALDRRRPGAEIRGVSERLWRGMDEVRRRRHALRRVTEFESVPR